MQCPKSVKQVVSACAVPVLAANTKNATNRRLPIGPPDDPEGSNGSAARLCGHPAAPASTRTECRRQPGFLLGSTGLRGAHPLRPETQVCLERVIRDAELAAGLALVVGAPLEHQSGIAAAPGAHAV